MKRALVLLSSLGTLLALAGCATVSIHRPELDFAQARLEVSRAGEIWTNPTMSRGPASSAPLELRFTPEKIRKAYDLYCTRQSQRDFLNYLQGMVREGQFTHPSDRAVARQMIQVTVDTTLGACSEYAKALGEKFESIDPMVTPSRKFCDMDFDSMLSQFKSWFAPGPDELTPDEVDSFVVQKVIQKHFCKR